MKNNTIVYLVKPDDGEKSFDFFTYMNYTASINCFHHKDGFLYNDYVKTPVETFKNHLVFYSEEEAIAATKEIMKNVYERLVGFYKEVHEIEISNVKCMKLDLTQPSIKA